jgi:hypothetical protein
VRLTYLAWLEMPGPNQGNREVAAQRTVEEFTSWTVEEVLSRF